MDLELKGKAAIVTGASKGIGRAIALAFANEGCNVAICARGKQSLDVTAAELRGKGVSVCATICDVSEARELDAFLQEVHRAFGRVDALINNPSAIAMADDDEAWAASFNVDMMPAVRASRKVIPWMVENGGGSIIHVSSGSGRMAGSPPAYAAMKAALISHSKTLAVALASQRIRVNAVAPGSIFVKNGFWDVMNQQSPAIHDAALASIPSGRFGNPEEVASAVVFLSSPKASWITGALVGVDGGQYPANS